MQYCDDTWVEIVEMYHLVLFFFQLNSTKAASR